MNCLGRGLRTCRKTLEVEASVFQMLGPKFYHQPYKQDPETGKEHG
jgi:hypothetical protein